jgi:ferredoxin-NADP reductase
LVTSGWKTGTVAETAHFSPTARSLIIDVPGWPGNLAGQHVDVRLTAPDGYTAVRSYSIASSGSAERIELAVDELPTGEVSPYLVETIQVGDELELRGPLGRWFVWQPEVDGDRPVQLIGGGSGVVPLMAIARAHAASASTASFRMLYSVRTPADVYFAEELQGLVGDHFTLDLVYTRETPAGWPTPPGRVTKAVLDTAVHPVADAPLTFICGPTGFVEAVANALVDLGHPAEAIKTERFGGA